MMSRAYPRGRGGASKKTRPSPASRGLSPRTRGSPLGNPLGRRRRGPIPADAGEPAWRLPRARCCRAYPRGRGGAQTITIGDATVRGLSPRTRGSQDLMPGERFAIGPIPADAGEPKAPTSRSRSTRAYPRGRGGAIVVRVRRRAVIGLSPRTRGSRLWCTWSAGPSGPIPADAGEPVPRAAGGGYRRAYPRGRGGAGEGGRGARRKKGLSPRTRGSRGRGDPLRAARGPIPADAGEPMPWPIGRPWTRAYPRGRGGACLNAASKSAADGLSPRTRGSRSASVSCTRSTGPIPADAGEPSRPARRRCRSRAYPRGRGGALAQSGKDIWVEGLSPRTRGSPGRSLLNSLR